MKRILSLLLAVSGIIGLAFKSQASETSSAYHVLAIDAEFSGGFYLKHGIVSIGASLQDQDSNELLAFQHNLSLPTDRVWEEKCLNEFWNKHPELYNFVRTNTLLPQEAMEKFVTFLKTVEEKYPEYILVTDAPSIDIPWLDLYLELYTTRAHLKYFENGDYRHIWDTTSICKSLLSIETGDATSIWNLAKKLGFEKEEGDHNPLNDARYIASLYNYVQKIMEKHASSKKPSLLIQ